MAADIPHPAAGRRLAATTIRFRLFLIACCVGLSVLALLAIGAATLVRSLEHEVTQETKTLVELARAQATSVADETHATLEILATNPAILSGDPQACQRELQRTFRAVARLGGFSRLGVLDLGGKLLCSHPAGTAGSTADRPIPLPLDNGHRHFEVVHEAGADGTQRHRHRMIVPVPSHDGAPAAFLLAEIDHARLQSLLGLLPLPPHAGAFLVDGQGHVMAAIHSAGTDYWRDRNVTDSALWTAVRGGADGTGSSLGFDSVPRLFVQTDLSDSFPDLKAVITFPTADLFDRAVDRSDATVWSLSLLALVMLVLLAAGYLLIVRHIDELVRIGDRLLGGLAASEASAAVLRGPAGPSNRSELKQIADSLLDMAERLRQRNAELEQAHRIGRLGSWSWHEGAPGASISTTALAALGLASPIGGPETMHAYLALVAPEDRARVRSAIRALLRDGASLEIEHRLATSPMKGDGPGDDEPDERIVRLRGECLEERDGARCFIGTVQDVTAERRLERRYDRERLFLRAILDNLSDGVIAYDTQPKIQFVNRVIERTYGRPVAENPPEDVAAYYSIYNLDGRTHPKTEDLPLFRALRGEKVEDIRLILRPPGQVPRTMSYSGQRILDDDGKVQGAVIVQRDLTEMLHAQETIARREAEYRQIFEAARDAFLVVNEDATIRQVNGAAAELYGYSAEELIGSDVLRLLPDGEQDWVRDFARRAANGETYRRESEHLNRTGERLPVEVIGSHIRLDGQDALLAVVRDVRERRRAEAQMLRMQRLEAVGQLTGGVAHEFNNLLQVVIMNLDLLEAEAEDRPELRESVEAALGAALRGSELIEQLLAFSREQALKPDAVNLNDVLRAHLTLLDKVAGSRVSIATELHPALDPVDIDPIQFETALIHLVSNARDAMPDGGRLTIATANLTVEQAPADEPKADIAEVGTPPPGSYVTLTVSDNGCGMDEETRDRAFEPFFTTKEVGKGSGLGLSMIFGFVTQSKGAVTIASAPGEGTAVTLYLPRRSDSGPDV